jgi:hypothetical protein
VLSVAVILISAPAVSAPSAELFDVFMKVCVKGQAVFPAGSAKQVGIEDLPINMRTMIGWRATGQFLEVIRPAPAYVAFTDKGMGPDHERACHLAGKAIDLEAVRKQLVKLFGQEPGFTNTGRGSWGWRYFFPSSGTVLRAALPGRNLPMLSVIKLNKADLEVAKAEQKRFERQADAN